MKKYLSISVMVFFFLAEKPEPAHGQSKLYPEIASFFSSLDASNVKSANLSGLETIKYNLRLGEDSIVFACSGNSFRSQALQVFFQSWASVKKYKRVKLYSCGYKAMEIDPRLIVFLEKVGYRITKETETENTVYYVKYGEKYPAIKLIPKACHDASLPQDEFISVLVCEEANGSCEHPRKKGLKITLNYKDRGELLNQEDVNTELTQMATDIYYVFNNK